MCRLELAQIAEAKAVRHLSNHLLNPNWLMLDPDGRISTQLLIGCSSSAPLGEAGKDWVCLAFTPAEANTGRLREPNREGIESACRNYNGVFLSFPISYMGSFSAAHHSPNHLRTSDKSDSEASKTTPYA